MKRFIGLIKALAEENRLRALMALRGGELCVCQITELLGLAPSTVSKHMSILSQAGLVMNRKDGRWVYYSLPGPETEPEATETIAWVVRTLAKSDKVQADDRKLSEILKIDKEELCLRQGRCPDAD